MSKKKSNLVMVDCGQPEYLDGVTMQYEVRDRSKNGPIIAYVDDAEHARLFAASRKMLKALAQTRRQLDFGSFDEATQRLVQDAIKAAQD